MKKDEFIISVDDAERRLDRVIRIFCKDTSLSALYGAVRKGLIRINGKKVKAGYKTVQGDVLSIASVLITGSSQAGAEEEPCLQCSQAKDDSVHAVSKSCISVLLQTEDLLIINKPAGIAVHGEHSVSSMLSENTETVQRQRGLSFRMGPLHRLDKYTTGIVCFSQSLAGAQWFSKCLSERSLKKYYIGVTEGKMQDGIIHTGGGQGDVLTHCFVLGYNPKEHVSCVLFRLITGKKHQIRKHAQYCGHPLAGDRRYGSKKSSKNYQQYILHAWRLYFPQERLKSLPDYLEASLPAHTGTYLDRFFPGWLAHARKTAADDAAGFDLSARRCV